MSGLLTASELSNLTDYQRPADQRKWLDRNGVPYYVGATGRPKVLWSDLERHQAPPTAQPKWSAVR